MKKKNKTLFIGVIVFIILTSIIIYNTVITSEFYFERKIILFSGNNNQEIKAALMYYDDDSQQKQAMKFLIYGMLKQQSYNNVANCQMKKLMNNENLADVNNLYNKNYTSFPEPKKEHDIQSLSSKYIVDNVEYAYNVWKYSLWHDDVDFNHFCNYILPYKIEDEPICYWRKYLHDKYKFLIKGISSQREAFDTVYKYIEKTFPVKRIDYPYKQDVLLLDNIGGGDCKARATYMVYVMRSLGISAALDYSPVWANYGENAHSWVVLVENNNKIYIPKNNKINHIDGTYETYKYYFDKIKYPYTVDSIKKISKVYRTMFVASDNYESKERPKYCKNIFSRDVTEQYINTTSSNIIKTYRNTSNDLYVCTYKQQEGWVAIGQCHNVGEMIVDIGHLIHDNVVIVAEYIDNVMIPVSYPYIISHDSSPTALIPHKNDTESILLRRKYILLNRWTNRWGELIGTTIETSSFKDFRTFSRHYTCADMPTEETFIELSISSNDRYLRIFPSVGKFPTFSEIQLIDKTKKIIPSSEYSTFAIGKNLSGDSLVVKSLNDNNEETTFFKQFPFWIGFDISRCWNKISEVKLILWNDGNRIQEGHCYELFYFNKEWISLGKRIAKGDTMRFNAPRNALLLLRDYTKGKEERIFTYKEGKQIWW